MMMLPQLVIAAAGAAIVTAIFTENSKSSQRTNADVMNNAMQYGYDIKHTSSYTDAYGNTSYSTFEFTNPRNHTNQMNLYMYINGEWVPANFTADGIPLPYYNPSLQMNDYQSALYRVQQAQGNYSTILAFQKPIFPPGFVQPNWVYADKELQQKQISDAIDALKRNTICNKVQ
jgi:hypothetical protein